MKCPRCDWQSQPPDEHGPAREQLQAHAVEAEHPHCIGCGRILAIDETRTCGDWPGARPPGDPTCVQRGLDLVSGVLTCWTDLHDEERVWPRASMLGGGGRGDMPRRLLPAEQTRPEQWWVTGRFGPLPRLEWQRLEAARAGKEHLIDNLPTDPPDVRYELEQWEDDWRHELHETAANITMRIDRVEWWVPDAVGPLPPHQWRVTIRKGGPGASVDAAGKYLTDHMRWAARHHPAFDEFLREMTALHAKCQAAVGRAPVEPAGLDVACLDCGGQLQHPVIEVTEEQEGRAWTGPALDVETRQCRTCGKQYDEQRFLIAQAETAARRAQVVIDGEIYGQVTRVARDLGRSRQTIHTWIRQDLVRSWESRGLVFVHVQDATELHRERGTRRRTGGAA